MFPIFFPIKHLQLQGALLSSFPPGPWTASGHSPCKPRGVLLISTEGGRVCPAFPLNMGAFPTEMLDFTMIFTTMLPMKWIQMVDFTIKEIGTWTPKIGIHRQKMMICPNKCWFYHECGDEPSNIGVQQMGTIYIYTHMYLWDMMGHKKRINALCVFGVYTLNMVLKQT